MNKELNELLNQYKETEKALTLGIEWLEDKDYANGKLDLVKVIIHDLEELAAKEEKSLLN